LSQAASRGGAAASDRRTLPAGVGAVVGLGLAVGTGVGVFVGTEVDVAVAVGGCGPAGRSVGVPMSGWTGSSAARLTVAELGTTNVRIKATATRRRTIGLGDISTIMRTGAECCRWRQNRASHGGITVRGWLGPVGKPAVARRMYSRKVRRSLHWQRSPTRNRGHLGSRGATGRPPIARRASA
jgi:hypothetical protein